MEALRRCAPVSIAFEAMDADTDGYFSADDQRIAIRQGMSEVQTVSATVHEIAHSRLHDPKKYETVQSWKVVLESEGETKHDLSPVGYSSLRKIHFAEPYRSCKLTVHHIAFQSAPLHSKGCICHLQTFYGLIRRVTRRNTPLTNEHFCGSAPHINLQGKVHLSGVYL